MTGLHKLYFAKQEEEMQEEEQQEGRTKFFKYEVCPFPLGWVATTTKNLRSLSRKTNSVRWSRGSDIFKL